MKYVNPALPLVDTQGQQNGDNKVYVIEGLLDQALLNSAVQAFDVRIAACTCLEVRSTDLLGSTLADLHRATFLEMRQYGYIS